MITVNHWICRSFIHLPPSESFIVCINTYMLDFPVARIPVCIMLRRYKKRESKLPVVGMKCAVLLQTLRVLSKIEMQRSPASLLNLPTREADKFARVSRSINSSRSLHSTGDFTPTCLYRVTSSVCVVQLLEVENNCNHGWSQITATNGRH